MEYTYTDKEKEQFIHRAAIIMMGGMSQDIPARDAARRAVSSAHTLLKAIRDYPDSSNEWISKDQANDLAKSGGVNLPEDARDMPNTAYRYKNGTYYISRSYVTHLIAVQ